MSLGWILYTSETSLEWCRMSTLEVCCFFSCRLTPLAKGFIEVTEGVMHCWTRWEKKHHTNICETMAMTVCHWIIVVCYYCGCIPLVETGCLWIVVVCYYIGCVPLAVICVTDSLNNICVLPRWMCSTSGDYVSLDNSCVLLRWMCSIGSDCVSLDSSCVLLQWMCSNGRDCVFGQ
jgi:hypothetical protein